MIAWVWPVKYLLLEWQLKQVTRRYGLTLGLEVDHGGLLVMGVLVTMVTPVASGEEKKAGK